MTKAVTRTSKIPTPIAITISETLPNMNYKGPVADKVALDLRFYLVAC